jgi:protein-S-isoprenylcysteine O-methyltransferase Ste14
MATPGRGGFARAVLAFLAMPGVVAFAIPIGWIASRPAPFHAAGLLPLALGIAGLGWCVRDFYVIGGGTLAPWAPPTRLVIVGLYRYSRNPMYVSVVLILLGWAATFAHGGLLAYAAVVALAFHLRVVLGEEPWLERSHGDAWRDYARRVPRWVIRSAPGPDRAA